MNETKKLYRSETDRWIFGVCGGLAEYFDIDPIIVRIMFVILALADGIGILVYIIMAIIVPTRKPLPASGPLQSSMTDIAPEIAATTGGSPSGKLGARNLAGIVIVILGIIMLLNTAMPFVFHWINWRMIAPLAVILFGAFLLIKKD